MTTYALDASTILALCLSEPRSEAVEAFLRTLDAGDSLIGPGLLLAECTSIIRERIFYGEISEDRGYEALQVALELGITPVVDDRQHAMALRFGAVRKTRKAYDEHYIAAAALSNSELVTIDSGMYQGAVNFKVPARLIR